MLGKTHRAGGALSAVLVTQFMATNQYLTDEINMLSKFLIVYPFVLWSCTASDLDLGADCIPTDDPVSVMVNRGLHFFNKQYDLYKLKVEKFGGSRRLLAILKLLRCSHRSWQTHSDLTLGLLIAVLWRLLSANTSGGLSMNQYILALALTGIVVGMISHLLLDMLNPDGIKSVVLSLFRYICIRLVRIISGSRRKVEFKFVAIHLVPRNPFFDTTTNTEYERFIQSVTRVTTYLYMASLVVIYCVNSGTFNRLIRIVINLI